MGVSVVVGGQYGSEGKGKVALHFAKKLKIKAAVKVSGTNSGHTVYASDGVAHIFRVLPTACILPDVYCIFPAGCYFQPELLFKECEAIRFDKSRLMINPNAGIITPEISVEEKETDLKESIGSTLSGTGLATYHRVACDGKFVMARDIPELWPYLSDTTRVMRGWLDHKENILIEGGQGFGLSYFHTPEWPYCTSRDTTASGFVADAGLSPLDVDNIIMVLRSYEIRVAGNSGPMAHETTWEQVTKDAKSPTPITEKTSVTKKTRRVGYFDYDLVAGAVRANDPNIVVMNFMDYIAEEDNDKHKSMVGPKRFDFLLEVERQTRCRITHVGFSGDDVRTLTEATKL